MRQTAKAVLLIAALAVAAALCAFPLRSATPKPSEVRFVNDGCLAGEPSGVLVVTRDGRLQLTLTTSDKVMAAQLDARDVDSLFGHLAQWAAEKHPPPTATERLAESVGWCTFDVAGKRFQLGRARIEGAFGLAREDVGKLWRMAAKP